MLLIGIMYEEADGISLDYAKAAMWYEISMRYGGDASFASRIAENMSSSELSRSGEWATQCIESNFDICGDHNSGNEFVSELYCTLTNVQGGILGQNDGWFNLGQNSWTKTVLPQPFERQPKGALNLGPGLFLDYEIIDVQGETNVLQGTILLDVNTPGYENFNKINRYSNVNLRLRYKCFDQKVSFIRNIVGE